MSTKYAAYDPLDDDPDNVVPDSIEVALVGVTRKGEFQYYVLPELLCYLDYLKFLVPDHTFTSVEGLTGGGVECRFNIYIVDEAHEEEYFKHLEPYKRSCERLQEELLMCICQDERFDYWPTILMDFDRHDFRSYFPEPKSFECFVPDGWTTSYQSIDEEDIPPDKRFWRLPDGTDLMMEEF